MLPSAIFLVDIGTRVEDSREFAIKILQTNIEEENEIRWGPDPILIMKNRFRSDGMGESEIVYTNLYPNR
jgi:hypothetical protein